MFRIKAMDFLRKRYGKRYQAFPMDELEVTEWFYWLNAKIGRTN